MPPINEAPPPLPTGFLRVIPLGGVGEIGRNMAVLEYDGRLLIIDCGVLFPEEHQPGVDLVLPDFTHLQDRWDDIEAVILTHGHEDHIGGVPYLIQAGLRAPLVGSRFTLGLLDAKLTERRLDSDETEVTAGQTVRFGPFTCEFVAVNHSIPDALAVAVTTGAGTVFHTGDFKADLTPLDNRLTDMASFYKLGERGVDLLMSDSTNADVPGVVATERDIGPVLDRVVGEASGRVFVVCTSSHVHRIQQVLNTARNSERHVAIIGRSMVRNVRIAEELGYLTVPPGLVLSVEQVNDLPADRMLVLCTGSQGEPAAALSRMATGQHKDFTLAEGDAVIFASSLIPGNESAVYRLIDRLAYAGVDVITRQQAPIHVSGHAAAGELTAVLTALRPRNFMPVHGEGRHLRAHAKLAMRTGVPQDRIIVARDGAVVDLGDGKASVVGQVSAGYTYVDGGGVGDVGEESLRDRLILGDEGFISAVVVVDSRSGTVVAGPEISARGFADEDAPLDDIRQRVADDIANAPQSHPVDPDELRRVIRRSIGSQVNRVHRRRPMILVYVVET
ncbi:MAG TPA: ribonuclease J [Nocardioides sp.]|uniref:ribonuclease J n=1 Tax=uncultured Nocardioides sp. TaxID=198441 RepID=UPI002636BB0E|nr:ribonuclease J [uncultured Nocardioides sp.]HRI97339.1 ribonuclease J [Nocardioides sp.]HRK47016.1 ribonuclease J [Nocardioides sp.]